MNTTKILTPFLHHLINDRAVTFKNPTPVRYRKAINMALYSFCFQQLHRGYSEMIQKQAEAEHEANAKRHFDATRESRFNSLNS